MSFTLAAYAAMCGAAAESIEHLALFVGHRPHQADVGLREGVGLAEFA